jgi:hypothetical protein
MARPKNPEGTREAKLAVAIDKSMRDAGTFARTAAFPDDSTADQRAQVAAAIALLDAEAEGMPLIDELHEGDRVTHGKVSDAFDEGVALCAATRPGRRPSGSPLLERWQDKRTYVSQKVNATTSEDTLRRARHRQHLQG